MLRLIVQPALVGFLCTLASVGFGEPTQQTWLFERDELHLELWGGCADDEAAGLWLFVGVRHPEGPSHTVELWFVDVSPGVVSERLHVVGEEPVSQPFPVGCVVANGASLAWRLVDRGRMVLHRLSRDGLHPIRTEVDGRWDYPIRAVALHQDVLTFVADDAVGIVDTETGTVVRHARWTAAAWVEPGAGTLYSVRSVEGDDDAEGFPPVALVREAVQPDGGLTLLASTEPWPAMRAVDGETTDDTGGVNHQLGATGDEIVLLRSHFLGSGRVELTTWAKTLLPSRAFAVETHYTSGRHTILDSSTVDGNVVVAAPKYYGDRAPVRLLYIGPTGVIREATAPEYINALVQNLKLLNLGRYTYAVATRWMLPNRSRAITIDAFATRVPP